MPDNPEQGGSWRDRQKITPAAEMLGLTNRPGMMSVRTEVMEKIVGQLKDQTTATDRLVDLVANQTREIQKGNVIVKKGDSDIVGFLKQEGGFLGKSIRFLQERKEGTKSFKDLFTGTNILTTTLKGLSFGLTKFGLPGVALFAKTNEILDEYTSYVKEKQAKKEEMQLQLIDELVVQQKKGPQEIKDILIKNGASDKQANEVIEKYEKQLNSTLMELLMRANDQKLNASQTVDLLKANNVLMEETATSTEMPESFVPQKKGKGKKGAGGAGFDWEEFSSGLSEGMAEEMSKAKGEFVGMGGDPKLFDDINKQLKSSHQVLKAISMHTKDTVLLHKHEVSLMDSQFKDKMAFDKQAKEDAEEEAIRQRELDEDRADRAKKGGIIDKLKDGILGFIKNSALGKMILGGLGSITGIVSKIVPALGGSIASLIGPILAVIAVGAIGAMIGKWISKNILGESTTGGERAKDTFSPEQRALAQKYGYTGPESEEGLTTYLRSRATAKMSVPGAPLPEAESRVEARKNEDKEEQKKTWAEISKAAQDRAMENRGEQVGIQRQAYLDKIPSNSDDLQLAYQAKGASR